MNKLMKIWTVLFVGFLITCGCKIYAADGQYTINDYVTQTAYSVPLSDNGDGTYAPQTAISTHSKIMLWDGITIAPIDREVPALVTISEEHNQAHRGTQRRAVATFLELADDATGYVLIRTTNTADTHLHISYNVGGNSLVTISSAPVITSTDTLLIVANLNQEDFSAEIGKTLMYKATISDIGGLIIDSVFLEGGSGPQSAGTAGEGAIEWVLGGGEDYLVSITNIAGQAKNVSVLLQWYEVAE